jgi:hypothetical protein
MKLRYVITLLTAGIALAQLAACSSKSTTPSAPTPPPIAHMYISINVAAGGVQIYNTPITASSVATGTISPLAFPRELFVERIGGRLFVPIRGGAGNTVNVYNAPITGSSTPAFVLTPPLTIPENVTEDGAGNVYVGVLSSSTCCIEAFAGPVTAPAAPAYSINSNSVINGLGDPYGMGFDTLGNLYVSSVNSILKFTPPFSSASVPTAIVLPNQDNFGLAVDASNTVYVANATLNGTIDVFTQPVTSSSVRAFGLAIGTLIFGLALDGSGNLWAVDSAGNIWEYTAPITSASVPTKVLTGITNAYGIAFGP